MIVMGGRPPRQMHFLADESDPGDAVRPTRGRSSLAPIRSPARNGSTSPPRSCSSFTSIVVVPVCVSKYDRGDRPVVLGLDIKHHPICEIMRSSIEYFAYFT